VISLLLLACASEPPKPIAAPPRAPRAREVRLVEGPTLVGLCDASAGAYDGRELWVADDESNELHRFRLDGTPTTRVDLSSIHPSMAGKEADLEGAATVSGRVWWVGSHDRGKGTTPRTERQRLFTIDEPPVLHVDLLDRLEAHDELGPLLKATHGITSKATDGFSIEGLAPAHDQALWVGMRAPLVDGEALLARFDLASHSVDALHRVDLDGRGIRALAHDGSDGLWVVAGPPADAGDFALFHLRPGAAPQPVSVPLGSLRPEGLVRIDERYLLLSDDGNVRMGDDKCKDLSDDQQRARTAWLELGAPPAPR
jgi:hypothetical protein